MPGTEDFLPTPPSDGPPLPRGWGVRWPWKSGNPGQDGTCYQDAWRYVIREEEGALVHGTALSLGKRIGHAWVELPTGYIWEPYSGAYLTRERFQSLVEPIEEHRYTVVEAAIMAARTSHHGPWTDEERAWVKK